MTRRRYIQIACLLALIAVFMAAPATMQAQVKAAGSVSSATGNIASLFGLSMWDFIAQGIANVGYEVQTIAAWALSLAGLALNYSVRLTLHIRDFVDATPAIFSTWRALRDISGLFIIFFLLYAAFQMILQIENPKWSALIKNIVMAGIVINFSFFFAGIGIDASNIVSTQLYNAIAPANSIAIASSADLSPTNVTSHLGDGGLADIFMSALKIPDLYNTAGQGTVSAGALNNGGSWTAPIKVLIIEVISIIIMLTAALSFFFAAVAFIVRFVVLIFLLAFSPIWFISFIAPQVEAYTKTWKDTYKSMLLFMPVYFLLMYLALNVLSSGGPLSILQTSGSGAAATAGTATATTAAAGSLVASALAAGGSASVSNAWYTQFLALGINAVVIIILLNMPLLAAISIGGKAVKFIDTKKWGAQGIWSKVGTRTIGKAAARLNDSETMRGIYARNPNFGLLASKQLSKVSSATFGGDKGGYDAALKARTKDLEGLDKRIGTAKRENYKSDDSFKKAEARAKGLQSTFQTSLASVSPLTLMMQDPANMSHMYKTAKTKRDKESAKVLGKEKRSLEGRVDDNNTQIAFITKEIARGTADNGRPLSAAEIQNMRSQREALQRANEDMRTKLDKIEDDLSKLKTGTSIDDIASKIEGLEGKIGDK
ncbi:MAG: hypothetical protein KGI69_00025 [Patescibacteria group bacterium]|nr:hypothetical protein [Patescibacteria group bacterium]